MKLLQLLFLLFTLVSCNKKVPIETRYSNGKVKSMGLLIDNLKEGDWIYFDSEGDTIELLTYLEDTLICKIEYGNNWRLRKTEYKGGAPNGRLEMYFPDGSIECEGTIQDSKPIGVHTCYFENGVINRSIDYTDGTEAGKFIQYYKNGNVMIKSDKLGEGLHLHYDSFGNEDYHIIFENFKPVDTLEIQ